MRTSFWIATSLLLSLLALAPSASATTCAQRDVYVGPLHVFDGEVGTGCLGGTVYVCTATWFGGHGLLGGFVIQCEPTLEM